MASSIIMPKTGMAMETGVIIRWLVAEGDRVSRGAPIAEIETDKTTMELECDHEGVMLKIIHPAGTVVPVTETIAWVGVAGEAVPESDTEKPAQKEPVKRTPAAQRLSQEHGIDLAGVEPTGNHGEVRARDVVKATQAVATPLARRVARDLGVDLEKMAGSGIRGKIFAADIVETKNGDESPTQRVRLTTIQKITGARLLESTRTIPSVTNHIKADLSELMKTLERMNGIEPGSVSLNAFLMLGVAKALLEHPRLNAVLEGDYIVYQGEINIGMAVASSRGLLVPVIHRADGYSLKALTARTKSLAETARQGKATPELMDGATFTISNLGKYGTAWFTPIINPPQAAILGICGIEDTLKLADGVPVVRQVIGLSLSYDHRIIDGVDAAEFLQCIRAKLEAPLSILM